MSGITKAKETGLATTLVAGTKKHLSSVASLTLDSVAYTPVELVTALQTLIDLYTAADAAKSAVKAKLAALKAQGPTLRKLMVALESYVRLTFGGSPDVMADFGVTPKKVATPLTTEQKTVANAKRKATREARGTTGKKAKKAIKGDVVDVVSTPMVAGKPVAQSSEAASAPAPAGGATAPTSGTTGTPGTTSGTTSHGA
jgi:hypothetical protein